MASSEKAEVDAAIGGGAALSALYDHSGLALAFLTIGGRFLRVNAAFCRMLGYSEEELLQKTHLDVVHVDDLEAPAIARAQVISGKARARINERRYVHKDGSTVWAHAGGAVVRDDSSNAICTVLFVDDITSIKRPQRNAKRRFRRLIEMGSDWYLGAGHRVAASHRDDSDIVVGKTRWELPGLGALLDKVWEQHRARLARRESFSDFVFLKHNKAGGLRYLSVSGEPLFDEKGNFRGYHGVGQDITERARAEGARGQREALSHAVRRASLSDVGGRCEDARVPRGERGRHPAVRLFARRVPADECRADPAAGGRRGPAPRLRRSVELPRAHLAATARSPAS